MKIASILLIILTLIARPAKVYGQSLSLSIWPPLLEIMIQPGRTVTHVYRLTNNSEQELLVTPYLFAFEPLNEFGQIKIKELSATGGQQSGNFFSFESREKFGEPFPVPINTTKELVLKIHIPPETSENDYYHTLLFSTAETALEKEGAEGKAGSVTQIGSNILLTVSKSGKPELLARIAKFSAPFLIDSFSETNLELILENWGKAFWKPFGKIEITGLFNQKEELKVLEQNVLAGSMRKINLEPFSPKIPLGPFKAKLVFSPNENGQSLNEEVVFWYFPFKVVISALIFLFVFFHVRKLAKRRQNSS
ncbi:hypothetical protein C4578_02540 [Candidatus Microgenomates bacterium]|nr:MAG: hypothetical protein C4578_02540 [Candidatus Microgenomates bacterium]